MGTESKPKYSKMLILLGILLSIGLVSVFQNCAPKSTQGGDALSGKGGPEEVPLPEIGSGAIAGDCDGDQNIDPTADMACLRDYLDGLVVVLGDTRRLDLNYDGAINQADYDAFEQWITTPLVLLGDIIGGADRSPDGEVDVADTVALLRIVNDVSIDDPPFSNGLRLPVSLSAADADQNGVVNAADAECHAQLVVGLPCD